MVFTLWEENGTIKESATGTLIECESCPCGAACSVCDPGTTPSSVTATFGAGTNIGGDEVGCIGVSGDCDDFAIASFELPQLSQAQVDSLNASCSTAFTDQPNPVAGCYYGLTAGLPCACDAMILEILDGGTSGPGLATGGLTMCWSAGGATRLDWQIGTADTDQDCLTNIDTSGGGTGPGAAVAGASDPCDFIGFLFDPTLLDLVANP